MIDNKKLKLYVIIPDSVPDDWAPLVATHGPLGFYLVHNCNGLVQAWVRDSYKKVVCKVSDSQFEHLKTFCILEKVPHLVTTESGLDNKEVSLVVGPTTEQKHWLRSLKMWKVTQ